jgi:DNA-binding transcriptional regulator YiaG
MSEQAEALYHYTESGLDWVYLANGYHLEETPYGQAVSIENVDGLHHAILLEIITGEGRIRGQELRFVRSMLDISQEGMSRILGVTRVHVARMEGKPTKPISHATDHSLRFFCALKIDNHDVAERLVELVNELDRLENEQRATFRETDGGWLKAA